MAISVKTDVGNFELDQGQTGEGALGGSVLGLVAAILAHLKGQTKPERPTTDNINSEKMLPKDIAKYGSKVWPDVGKMVQTLPEIMPEIMPEIAQTITKILPKYGSKVWPDAGKMVQTLPETGTINESIEKNFPKDYGGATWPDEGKMVETLPPGQTAILDITTPATPPNYGTATWPDEGKMVETLPLGQTDNLEVTRPIAPETTTTPNYGTATWPDEGKMVETLPLGDTGKLDVTKPIIDVRPNVDVNTGNDVGTDAGANEWVSGAINATTTWPNEGQMIETIPPYIKDEPNFDWSGPMITDKTNENNEVTINPVTFDSFYDLIRAEQQERWMREDKLRYEQWAREDSALQRWVTDSRKSGINPNLALGFKGAESSGGFNTATGMNYAMWESGLQKEIALLQQSIDQNFKGDENDKDRFVQLLGNVLSMFSVIAMFKGKI